MGVFIAIVVIIIVIVVVSRSSKKQKALEQLENSEARRLAFEIKDQLNSMGYIVEGREGGSIDSRGLATGHMRVSKDGEWLGSIEYSPTPYALDVARRVMRIRNVECRSFGYMYYVDYRELGVFLSMGGKDEKAAQYEPEWLKIGGRILRSAHPDLTDDPRDGDYHNNGHPYL